MLIYVYNISTFLNLYILVFKNFRYKSPRGKMPYLKNLLKELNPPSLVQKQYVVQFLGLTNNFKEIPVIENIRWHPKTDKIKILIIFGIDEAPSQNEFILPILQSTLKTIESLPILISIIPFANLSGEH